MTIRKYVALVGHEIVGNLTRRPEWEHENWERCYIDDAGNEYTYNNGSVVIVTADGAVI